MASVMLQKYNAAIYLTTGLDFINPNQTQIDIGYNYFPGAHPYLTLTAPPKKIKEIKKDLMIIREDYNLGNGKDIESAPAPNENPQHRRLHIDLTPFLTHRTEFSQWLKVEEKRPFVKWTAGGLLVAGLGKGIDIYGQLEEPRPVAVADGVARACTHALGVAGGGIAAAGAIGRSSPEGCRAIIRIIDGKELMERFNQFETIVNSQIETMRRTQGDDLDRPSSPPPEPPSPPLSGDGFRQGFRPSSGTWKR